MSRSVNLRKLRPWRSRVALQDRGIRPRSGPLAQLPLVVGVMLGLGVIGAAGCAVPVSLAGPSRAATVMPSAEAAVAQLVEEGGTAFAGPCSGTRSPDDMGKVCSRFVAERAGVRAYVIGRTFSEFDRWVFVAESDGGWAVAGQAPLDFTSTSIEPPWPV